MRLQGPAAPGAEMDQKWTKNGPKMQKTLNLKVKYRESFRPFAPSVLREDVSDWFEADYDSPYMLLVDDVKKDKRIEMTKEEESLFGIDKLNVKRSSIPAITHVDYSARIQTVHKDTNPKYHALITKFKEKPNNERLQEIVDNILNSKYIQKDDLTIVVLDS